MCLLICLVLLFSLLTPSYASQNQLISVTPINIEVNGKVFQPKDANGNPVSVFTYNGTTYAPLRALAEAYGLTVGYDSEKKLATVDFTAADAMQLVAPRRSANVFPNGPRFPSLAFFAGDAMEFRNAETTEDGRPQAAVISGSSKKTCTARYEEVPDKTQRSFVEDANRTTPRLRCTFSGCDDGEIECSVCDGDGGWEEYDTSSPNYTGVGGRKEWKQCSNCGGDGEVACHRCGGDGWMD